MSAIDDIEKLLAAMKDRGAEMKAFEGLLGEVSVSLAEILAIMEKPGAGDMAVANAIVEGMKSLQAPHITVQPAQIVMQSSKGWKMTVTGRDGNGAIQAISFKPEV